MENLQYLKINIEIYRAKLIELLALNSPTYPDVIVCSQMLDNLIVEYEKTILTNKKVS